MAQVDKTRVAIVGTGSWGINHVRVFASDPTAEVVWVCDESARASQKAAALAPGAKSSSSIEPILEAGDVDAMVLATPAITHADLACRALEAGLHVFVEKPLSLNVGDAERVKEAADRHDRIVMVGHLMLYHPVVGHLKELLESGELGELFYLYSRRVNLGRLRTDENALWSFAPHDISMIDYFMGEEPVSVAARGESYLQPGIEDVVFVTLKFRGRQMAHIHLSWLDPRKERRLTIVGSQKMAEFDDVGAEKLRIYDKGYDSPPTFTRFEQYLTIRRGDVHIPHVSMKEPLGVECRHFLECARSGETPRSGIASALRVVKVLAAAQQSLEQDGAPVLIE